MREITMHSDILILYYINVHCKLKTHFLDEQTTYFLCSFNITLHSFLFLGHHHLIEN
jgi:hypothetical protein